MTASLHSLHPEPDRRRDQEVERQVAYDALGYGPDYRRAYIRVQEARGVIDTATADRIIRRIRA